MLQVSRAFALKTRRRTSAFSDSVESQRFQQARLTIDFAISNVFAIEAGAVARHYGIAGAPADAEYLDDRPVRVRHWGTGDYRPQIAPDAV